MACDPYKHYQPSPLTELRYMIQVSTGANYLFLLFLGWTAVSKIEDYISWRRWKRLASSLPNSLPVNKLFDQM